MTHHDDINALPRKLLLHGGHGTGKTMMVKSAVRDCGIALIEVKAWRLHASYAGNTDVGLRNAFAMARNSAPAVVLLDEMETLFPAAESDRSMVDVAETVALMAEMSCDERVLVVGIACELTRLSRVLRKRFDVVMRMEAPTGEERGVLLRHHLEELGLTPGEDVDVNEIGMMCHGFVGADLAGMCRRLALDKRENDGEWQHS